MHRTSKIPDTIVEQMRELKRGGYTFEKIAQMTGYSVSAVLRRVKENGEHYPGHKKRTVITQDLIDTMHAYAALGLANSQIAIELGVHPHTVLKHVGPQKSGRRAACGSLSAHVTGESFLPKGMEKESNALTWNMQGKKYTYTITDTHVKIGDRISISLEDLPTVMTELNFIQAAAGREAKKSTAL